MLKKLTNTLRALSLDMIDKANSGHPGIALGAAPIVASVYEAMKYNPDDDNFFNRDRFVLSAGHGSSLLYSAISLFTNGLSIEDLKSFRQLGSKTPGHPEKNITPFVEVSTGPLGQGVANAVGMAIAEKKLAQIFNKKDAIVIDHFTYCLAGDGCLMEGVALEALEVAVNLNLNKLIILFDSNNTTIEGTADLAQTNNLEKVYKAKGFNVIIVKNGNDENCILKAIEKAKKSSKPSFIIIKTVIGFGSEMAGTSKAHGTPLKKAATIKIKEKLKLNIEPFSVSDDVFAYENMIKNKKREQVKSELSFLENYYEEYYKSDYTKLISFLSNKFSYKSDLPLEENTKSTRDYGGKYLNEMSLQIENLIGGAADVAPSTKQFIKDSQFISCNDFSGRNIHFGIREHAMAAISNGILAHKGFKVFNSTFMSFSDYCKAALRMSALMNLPLISIFTSDTIGAGEDGPTHQPVEQLATLRAIPNMTVMRPADEKETAAAYEIASQISGPSSIILTRQKLPIINVTSYENSKKGFYIVYEPKNKITGIILASGSEVSIAIEAAKVLETKGKNYRVVSCFCTEIYESQPAKYKESILPLSIENRIICEAGSSFGLAKYAGLKGQYVTIDVFGKSAKGEDLFEYYKITAKQIIKLAK